MSEYDPNNPPPEPDLGSVVKDRHGALSMRQRYGTLEGWGDPYGGTMPFGKWADMWEARGPLEIVPPPWRAKEEEVLDRVHLVVSGGDHGGQDVLAVFSKKAVAEEFSKNGDVLKIYPDAEVKGVPLLTEVPQQVILYRKRSGGTVVVEKFWDFEVEERISQGWFRTVEEAFEAGA